jgi:uncharacterized protein (DUF2249 family)
MSDKIVTLDVRDDLRHGREPFSKVMGAVAQLQPDERLRLVAPFEPTPLISVLGHQGFDHASKPTPGGDWEVWFTRRGGATTGFIPPTAPPCRAAPTPTEPTEIIEVDARGLEPPQPMVKILEALADLPAGAGLRAHTERKPMHLYAQLEERGFVGDTAEQKDGSHVTRIRRR